MRFCIVLYLITNWLCLNYNIVKLFIDFFGAR